MTAVIEAPKALPADHKSRRRNNNGRLIRVEHSQCFSGPEDNRVKTGGTTRYYNFDQQDLAAAYYQARQDAKLASAKTRAAQAFVMPSLSDLPTDNPPAILRSLCVLAVNELRQRLEVLDGRPGCARKERSKLNARIAAFEAELAKYPATTQASAKRKAKKK